VDHSSKPAASADSGGGIVGALAAALAQRKNVIQGSGKILVLFVVSYDSVNKQGQICCLVTN
jgi:hypothetical protein